MTATELTPVIAFRDNLLGAEVRLLHQEEQDEDEDEEEDEEQAEQEHPTNTSKWVEGRIVAVGPNEDQPTQGASSHPCECVQHDGMFL